MVGVTVRALVLARGNVIDRHEILLLDEHRASSGTTHWTTLVPLNNGWKQNVETLERSLVERALALAQGNKTRAAGILGVHRRLLYQKIRQHEL